MWDSDAFCSDCKRQTEVVFHRSAGERVCSECGLVLESHAIDEASERRTFATDSGINDPDRVGGPTNPLLADGGLSAFIAEPKGFSDDSLPKSLDRQHQGSKPRSPFGCCFRGHLYNVRQDRANEIFKNKKKSLRGRTLKAIQAACLYIACRQEDKPRTVMEICSIANGVMKTEIGRAINYIVELLGLEMGTVSGGEFVRRFGTILGMNNQAVRAAQEAMQQSKELDIRRVSPSIAATVLYIISQLSDDKKTVHDIILATGVAEVTIQHAYKDLYPHLSKIIPNWYAKEEDLKNICSP